jgi:hypothetical protein
MKNKKYLKLNTINNLTSYNQNNSNNQESTNNNESKIKKFRHNLLNMNLIKKIEENNKIQKEIEKMEKTAISKSLNRNKHKSIVDDIHPSSIFTKKFPFLIKYNEMNVRRPTDETRMRFPAGNNPFYRWNRNPFFQG